MNVALATSGFDATNGTAYTTASVNFVAKRTYILAAVASNSADVGAPVVSGTGTWTLINNAQASGSVVSRIYVWRWEPDANASGTVTVTWTNTAGRCTWVMHELTDADPTPVQSVTGSNTGTSGTITLAALRGAKSVCFGFFEHHANEVSTEGSGFTELGDTGGGGESLTLMGEYKENDTTVDASWATSVLWAGVAVEMANRLSMVSASTYTATVGSILQKMKNMVSSSTYTLTIGTSLQKMKNMLASLSITTTIGSALSLYYAWLTEASPDAQTLTAASPDTQTLTAASPDTQTLTAASPDTMPTPR